MTAPRPRPAVMGIAPYVPGITKVAGANRTVKLSSNEGAFGVPPGAQRAYAAAAAELFRYPDNDVAALRAAIGAAHGLDPARIVCGVGSDDILYQLCLSYGGPGTEIIMSRHGFSIYEIAGQYAGSTVLKAPERDLTTDVDALLALVSPATRLLFLANPNNPTGSLLPDREVRRLRDNLPPEVLLVLDAAYAEYVDDPGYEAGAALVNAGDNTVMTRTFSKIYGLGGVRLGWAYAPADVIDVLNRARVAFNVSAPAQAAGIAALAEPGWVEHGRTHNSTWRAWLTERLSAAGIRVWPSQANFVLADFGAPAAAIAADEHLQRGGIIVRRVGGYGLPTCLRVTVGTEEECRLVADALAEFMANQQAAQPAAPHA